MNPVVTARVPEGIRSRGVDVLREIGATTSELVNAAFTYVIQERELPRPRANASGKNRTLNEQQCKQLEGFMDAVRIDIPDSWSDASFEELLDQAAEERYADLG